MLISRPTIRSGQLMSWRPWTQKGHWSQKKPLQKNPLKTQVFWESIVTILLPCRLIGRTSDSGSDYHGSIPCGATTQISQIPDREINITLVTNTNQGIFYVFTCQRVVFHLAIQFDIYQVEKRVFIDCGIIKKDYNTYNIKIR